MADDGWRTLVSPAALPRFLPRPPLASSPGPEPYVHHSKQAPGTIELPGLRDDTLVVFSGTPAMIEELSDERPRERRWVEASRVSLIPAGRPLRRNLMGNVDATVVHLPAPVMSTAAAYVYGEDVGRPELTWQFSRHDEVSARISHLLLCETVEGQAAGAEMIEALQHALAIHLMRLYSALSPAPEIASARMPENRFKNVIDYIHAHLCEPLPLVRLSKVSGLSTSQFLRAFKASTGWSPHRFITKVRLDRARTLLDDDHLSVTEVGLCSGFDRPSHFATVFRRATGLSPSRWRALRKDEPAGGPPPP